MIDNKKSDMELSKIKALGSTGDPIKINLFSSFFRNINGSLGYILILGLRQPHLFLFVFNHNPRPLSYLNIFLLLFNSPWLSYYHNEKFQLNIYSMNSIYLQHASVESFS